MIVVYTTVRVGDVGAPAGTKFLNPGFFSEPIAGAEAVYLNGNFPAVREAYELQGIPVLDLRHRKTISPLLRAPSRRSRRRKLD